MKKLIIEKAAVKNNLAVLKEKAGKSAIYAILSGDGGGAGLTELAGLLRGEGIGRFAVSEPAEAAALRKAGFIDEEILMLRATTDPEELEQLVDLNAVCTVSSIETGKYNPSLELAFTIADYFKLSIEEIFIHERREP